MNGYVLADDLSGALETGAVFRAAGQRVILPLDSNAPARGKGGVEVVSSETRNESPERAETIVRSILETRKKAGSRPVFKKIDSTMRGPVGGELCAVIRELDPPLIAFCPANPAAGRTVRDGKLLVRGVPLADSDFSKDPQWPARTSDVDSILESQGVSVGARISIEELRDPDPAVLARRLSSRDSPVVIFDAATIEDLSSIVGGVQQVADGALFVGSAALAMPLSRAAVTGCITLDQARDLRLGSLLVVCGSGHPVSHRQLDFLESRFGIEVGVFWVGETDEEALVRATVSSLCGAGLAAVRLCFRGEKTSSGAQQIQVAAGELVRMVVDRFVPDSLFLTGGETAWTVCRALGGTRLEVLRELEPGVVLSRLERTSGPGIFVVTKPGGYGSDTSVSDVAAMR